MDLAPRCPFCAHEMESADAVICLRCGYNIQTRARVETKLTIETTSADYFQWWLPAFVCIFGILLLIGWNVLFILLIAPGLKEDSVFFLISGGWAKVWQAIISAFLCFFMGKFAVQRLIFNPTPPEKEAE